MLKSNVGSSCLLDPSAAGREAATEATLGLKHASLLMVYASCDLDVSKVVEGVKSICPKVPVLGNTSFTGVIVPKKGYVGGDKPFVGVLALEDSKMKVAVVSRDRSKVECPYLAGADMAKEAMDKSKETVSPNFFYMAASPKEEESYLKGISSVIGRIPFFGGSAADNTIEGNWKLYAEDATMADGCICAFVWGDVKITNLFTGAYRETENVGVITKVKDRRTLVEIDHKPAAKVYESWSGAKDKDIMGGNLLGYSVTSPLGVKDRLGDLVAIRHPMHCNDDYSINCGNDLAEKTAVIRMEASVDELIQSVPETLKKLLEKCPEKPKALHLVHCGGRRAGIGDRIDEVVKGIDEVVQDIPYIVEFTFGEYGYVSDNNNTCGGLMLSFTALY